MVQFQFPGRLHPVTFTEDTMVNLGSAPAVQPALDEARITWTHSMYTAFAADEQKLVLSDGMAEWDLVVEHEQEVVMGRKVQGHRNLDFRPGAYQTARLTVPYEALIDNTMPAGIAAAQKTQLAMGMVHPVTGPYYTAIRDAEQALRDLIRPDLPGTADGVVLVEDLLELRVDGLARQVHRPAMFRHRIDGIRAPIPSGPSVMHFQGNSATRPFLLVPGRYTLRYTFGMRVSATVSRPSNRPAFAAGCWLMQADVVLDDLQTSWANLPGGISVYLREPGSDDPAAGGGGGGHSDWLDLGG
ncbi:hypothetical protein L6R53_23425 [Myxococcota bacterium]|nr:hypothetical protein [Myxococcota bacterium]